MRTFLASVLCGFSVAAASADVLLIPDSGNDKIWAFDPETGDFISSAFVAADGNMAQAISAIDSGKGTILVSDEALDRVVEYTNEGQFIRVVIGGIDAPFGMAVHDGDIYVCSHATGTIWKVSYDGLSAEPWAPGLGAPRDIHFRENDAIVTESGGDDLLRVGLDGTFIEILHNSDGITGIDFPQQLQIEGDGTILAAGFTAPFGLYEYAESGVQQNAYTNIITSPRGVYRLGNGKLLYAGGTRVMRYDPATLTEELVVNEAGTSFRFIERLFVPVPEDLNQDGVVNGADLAILLSSWDPCRHKGFCFADLNGSGDVGGDDLAILLAAWTA